MVRIPQQTRNALCIPIDHLRIRVQHSSTSYRRRRRAPKLHMLRLPLFRLTLCKRQQSRDGRAVALVALTAPQDVVLHYGALDLRYLAMHLLPHKLFARVMPLHGLEVWSQRYCRFASRLPRHQAPPDEFFVELAQLGEISSVQRSSSGETIRRRSGACW